MFGLTLTQPATYSSTPRRTLHVTMTRFQLVFVVLVKAQRLCAATSEPYIGFFKPECMTPLVFPASDHHVNVAVQRSGDTRSEGCPMVCVSLQGADMWPLIFQSIHYVFSSARFGGLHRLGFGSDDN